MNKEIVSFEEKLSTLRDRQKEEARGNLPIGETLKEREKRIKAGEEFFKKRNIKGSFSDILYPIMRDYTDTHDARIGSYYDELDRKVVLSSVLSWDIHLRDHTQRALRSFYFRQITLSCGSEGDISIIAGNSPLVLDEPLSINTDGWEEAVKSKIYDILQNPDSTLVFFEDETYVLRASEKKRVR